MTTPGALVNQVWSHAHVLRDDGVGYGDEQIACRPCYIARGLHSRASGWRVVIDSRPPAV